MVEGLSQFRADMDEMIQTADQRYLSSKTQRYVRAYKAGLPQDITVRWFPKEDITAMEARVSDLTERGLEVWISQGLPWNPDIDQQLTSVEKKTGLIKGLKSLDDFRQHALPSLARWENGSWAKMFYDTPQRALFSGTIRFDTNRHELAWRTDLRVIRLEAALGISDVRDLDRQMTAKRVAVVHPASSVVDQIENALKSLDCPIHKISDPERALADIFHIIHTSKSENIDQPKPREPKAILLDMTTFPAISARILKELRDDKDASSIPVIPIVEDEMAFPKELRSRVASYAHMANLDEDVRQGVFLTGFHLTGGPFGFEIPNLGLGLQRRIDGLLKSVFGPGGMYRRMMVQIANSEQRPTIAFEFKLVPTDPYDFFFLDYEWSGLKNPLHRFDWVRNFSDGS